MAIGPDKQVLRSMVYGAYDLQKLRIQAGLRLCANFRAKLKPEDLPETEEDRAEAEAKVEKAIDLIKGAYQKLTEGLVSERGRLNIAKIDFTADPIISTRTELTLIDQYIALEKQEARQFRDLETELVNFPIWTDYLDKVKGVGTAMGAVMIVYFDIERARHSSSFWKIAGLDVVVNEKGEGVARSRREEHLIDHHYKNKQGKEAVRRGVTYNVFLKTKLIGVLGPSMLRSRSPWRELYDQYHHRIMSDPARIKITAEKWKRAYAAKDPNIRQLWTPGRIHTASIRYMIKEFLVEFWTTWRRIEGLPVTAPYREAILKMPKHGGERAA